MHTAMLSVIPTALKRALPWLLLLVALAVSVVLINATAPSACDEIPSAFEQEIKTDVGGDEVGVYSSCEVTNTATGARVKVTEINWLGLVAALALCAAGWCLGALIGGVIGRRRGVPLLLAAGLVAVVTLVIIVS